MGSYWCLTPRNLTLNVLNITMSNEAMRGTTRAGPVGAHIAPEVIPGLAASYAVSAPATRLSRTSPTRSAAPM